MRKKVIAGNWKMNGLQADFDKFCKTFLEALSLPINEVVKKVDIVLALPYLLLETGKENLSPHGVTIAAQNCHWEKNGAYTGEISPSMLQEIGIKACLVAHSERRQYFNERNDTASKKVSSLLQEAMIPVLCVGETLDERKNHQTEQVIEEQLSTIFSSSKHHLEQLIIAYEPVWAIGTGLAATAQQANEVHTFIRKIVTQKCSSSIADSMKILYGGSMKPSNCIELLKQQDIDGGLIGGASLNPIDFAKIINTSIEK